MKKFGWKELRAIYRDAAKIVEDIESSGCYAIQIAGGFDSYKSHAHNVFKEQYCITDLQSKMGWWMALSPSCAGDARLRVKALRALASGHPERVEAVRNEIRALCKNRK